MTLSKSGEVCHPPQNVYYTMLTNHLLSICGLVFGCRKIYVVVVVVYSGEKKTFYGKDSSTRSNFDRFLLLRLLSTSSCYRSLTRYRLFLSEDSWNSYAVMVCSCGINLVYLICRGILGFICPSSAAISDSVPTERQNTVLQPPQPSSM